MKPSLGYHNPPSKRDSGRKEKVTFSFAPGYLAPTKSALMRRKGFDPSAATFRPKAHRRSTDCRSSMPEALEDNYLLGVTPKADYCKGLRSLTCPSERPDRRRHDSHLSVQQSTISSKKRRKSFLGASNSGSYSTVTNFHPSFPFEELTDHESLSPFSPLVSPDSTVYYHQHNDRSHYKALDAQTRKEDIFEHSSPSSEEFYSFPVSSASSTISLALRSLPPAERGSSTPSRNSGTAKRWLERTGTNFSTSDESSDSSEEESYRSVGSSLPCADHSAYPLSADYSRRRSNSWGSESSVPSLLGPVYQSTLEHVDLAEPWLQTSLYRQETDSWPPTHRASNNRKPFLPSSSECPSSSRPVSSVPVSSSLEKKKHRAGKAPLYRDDASPSSAEAPVVVQEAGTWLSPQQLKGHPRYRKISQRLQAQLSTSAELSFPPVDHSAVDDRQNHMHDEDEQDSAHGPDSTPSINQLTQNSSLSKDCTQSPQELTSTRSLDTTLSSHRDVISELSVSSKSDPKTGPLFHPLPGDVVITFSPLLSNSERDATFVYFQKEPEARTTSQNTQNRRAMLLRFGEVDRDGKWVANIQVKLFYKAANGTWRFLAKTFVTKLPWLHRSKRGYMRLNMPDPHFKPRSGDLIIRTVVSEKKQDVSWTLVFCDGVHRPLMGDMIVRAYVGPAPKKNNQSSRLLLGRVELYTRKDVYYIFMGRDQHTFPIKLRPNRY